MSCDTLSSDATVLAVRPGQLELAVTRKSACSACAEKNSCGSHSVPVKTQRVWILSNAEHQLGDSVQVQVPQDQVLRSALLMYGVPLSGFVIGLLVGAAWSEMVAMYASLGGLVTGFVVVALLARRWISPLQLISGDKHD